MKKKMKPKYLKVLLFIFITISILIIIYAIIHVILWYRDTSKINKQIEDIYNMVNIIETQDKEETQIIPQPEEISKENPYWDYINMNMINVNFNELKHINNEIVGWIKVNGTNINYPYVLGNDNSFYLTHSIDKSTNSAGWVFMDYRNNSSLNSKNNIIYAHGRWDNTMFGSLKNILKSNWLDDESNYVVKISTESSNSLWQVFSIYRIPTNSDYIKVNFTSNEEFINFTNKLIKRSNYDFKTSVNANDIILTLSTCYDDYEKVVLHAKLIKKETR